MRYKANGKAETMTEAYRRLDPVTMESRITKLEADLIALRRRVDDNAIKGPKKSYYQKTYPTHE
jgi:hypothetical protein